MQYPPREACVNASRQRLRWRAMEGRGELIGARPLIRHGQELYFRERAPWPVGIVRLDCGAER